MKDRGRLSFNLGVLLSNRMLQYRKIIVRVVTHVTVKKSRVLFRQRQQRGTMMCLIEENFKQEVCLRVNALRSVQ